MAAKSPYQAPAAAGPSKHRPSFFRSPLLIIPVLSLGYYALYLTSVLTGYGASMRAFETGAPLPTYAVVMNWCNSILQFPLITIAGYWGRTGHWGWLIVAANGLLWSTAAWLLICRRRKAV